MNVTTAPWVTRREVAPLPRLALLAFCALWLLPGMVGRDPWRQMDVSSFGVMLAMSEGRIAWWAPALGGVPVDAALLPHWIGALAIQGLGAMLGSVMAVRIAFAAIVMIAMAGIWYATFHLARTEAAQPVPMPFGGEAPAVDYARALADGALLAFIATFGLLQLGHETTSELVQLAAVSSIIWCVAAAPWRRFATRLGVILSLTVMAASGAPSLAVLVGLCGAVICTRSGYPGARQLVPWLLAAVAAAALVATALGAWRWRYALVLTWSESFLILRQWTWFLWPVWPLALWTTWRWRTSWAHRHVALPLITVLCTIACSVFMGGEDRSLLMAVPGMAILAAFALPTFKRQGSAAIDWFSIFFFSSAALFIWFMYLSMHTGWPAKPAANVMRLAPGYIPQFSAMALGFALAGTAGWLALVRWRTSRQVHPLWKSLVLPAGGVVLCWLLLMTLWLPLLDYARSYRPVVERVISHLPQGDKACVAVRGANPALVASLEVFSRRRYDATANAALNAQCDALIQVVRGSRQVLLEPQPGWQLQAAIQRPTDREEQIGVYRRAASSP